VLAYLVDKLVLKLALELDCLQHMLELLMVLELAYLVDMLVPMLAQE
jgi:hypothetical protein